MILKNTKFYRSGATAKRYVADYTKFKFYAFPNKTVELHFRLKVPGGETDIKIPFEKSDLTDMIKQIIKYNPNHIPYILETITTITQNIIKEKDALEDN